MRASQSPFRLNGKPQRPKSNNIVDVLTQVFRGGLRPKRKISQKRRERIIGTITRAKSLSQTVYALENSAKSPKAYYASTLHRIASQTRLFTLESLWLHFNRSQIMLVPQSGTRENDAAHPCHG
jgi:hypothetical protein